MLLREGLGVRTCNYNIICRSRRGHAKRKEGSTPRTCHERDRRTPVLGFGAERAIENQSRSGGERPHAYWCACWSHPGPERSEQEQDIALFADYRKLGRRWLGSPPSVEVYLDGKKVFSEEYTTR